MVRIALGFHVRYRTFGAWRPDSEIASVLDDAISGLSTEHSRSCPRSSSLGDARVRVSVVAGAFAGPRTGVEQRFHPSIWGFTYDSSVRRVRTCEECRIRCQQWLGKVPRRYSLSLGARHGDAGARTIPGPFDHPGVTRDIIPGTILAAVGRVGFYADRVGQG